MQVSEEERLAASRELDNAPAKSNSTLIAVAAIVALLLLAAGAHFFLNPEKPQAVVKDVPEIRVPEQPPEPPPPQVPVREVSEPEFSLPPLDLSDADFRERLINLSTDMAPWLQTEELIRRGVTFTDGLTRGEVLTNLVSIPPPGGKFIAERNGGRIYIAQENYQRYDYLIKIIESINPESLTNLFDLYRPLLEQAYGELGYKRESLGSKVIQALDQILKVPVTDSPVELKHESVYYTYADPELENLSPLQKQLLRMGPKATGIVQQKAKAFKEYLLKAPEKAPENDPEGNP